MNDVDSRPVANDEPFEVNDRVAIIRARHGWHDGQKEAVVIDRHRNGQGTWKYLVEDDDGQQHSITHTRDLRLVEKATAGFRR